MSTRPEMRAGQEWANNSVTVRIEEVLPNGAVVGTVQADGSLARRRIVLLRTLRTSYRLTKESA